MLMAAVVNETGGLGKTAAKIGGIPFHERVRAPTSTLSGAFGARQRVLDASHWGRIQTQ